MRRESKDSLFLYLRRIGLFAGTLRSPGKFYCPIVVLPSGLRKCLLCHLSLKKVGSAIGVSTSSPRILGLIPGEELVSPQKKTQKIFFLELLKRMKCSLEHQWKTHFAILKSLVSLKSKLVTLLTNSCLEEQL